MNEENFTRSTVEMRPDVSGRLRRRLAADPQRPAYHFLPPNHWINDPNGLIQWQGRYHLFYQHNPHRPLWGDIHWGHAVSNDLVHWTDLALALAPTPGGPDSGGCWSGCAVDADGTPAFFYTGVFPEVQCLATGSDDLTRLHKHEGNPVIAGPPAGLKVTGFRDPWVWQEGHAWFMALGSGIRGQGGAVLLYRSADLLHWEYDHPLLTGTVRDPGEVWECPNFFPLGNRHVLLVSIAPGVGTYYFIGRYADQVFTPEHQGWLDHGMGGFFAPQTLLDNLGRRLIIGWLPEDREQSAAVEAGWAGCLSVPRVLTRQGDGALSCAPVPELSALRGEPRRFADIALQPGTRVPLDGLQGEALDLVATIDPGDAAQVGLVVRASPGGEEETRLLYDRASESLILDRARSSLSEGVGREERRAPLRLAPGEPLKLRVLLDHSAIEVFAADGVPLTSRIYPSRPDSLGVGVLAEGGMARLQALEGWPMRSIWGD